MILDSNLHAAFDLLRNAAVIALGALGYCQLRQRLHGRLPPGLEQLSYGVLYAAVAAFCMLTSVDILSGSPADLHLAIVAIAAVFGGIGASAVASAAMVLLEVLGSGDPLAVQTIMISATFGLSAADAVLLRRRGVSADLPNLAWLSLACVGAVLIGIHLLGFPVLTLTLYHGGLAWIVILPLTIVGVGAVIRHFERNLALTRALQERESELKAIMDNAPLAIFLKDCEGRFRVVNRAYTEWFGDRPEDVQGRTAAVLYSPSIAKGIEESDKHVMEQNRTAHWERPIEVAKPGIEYVQVTKFPIRDDAGTITGLAGFVSDITERKRAEEILRWSEERLRALIENSNDIIVIIQPDGTISYRGPSSSEGLGFSKEEVIGRRLFDIVHQDDAAAIAETLRAIGTKPGLYAAGHSRVRHQDGSWRHIAWSARNAMHIPGVDGVVVNFHDVTEARRLEERLHQAQKMEAIGQLAGGIAHDFNNILGSMLGFAGFLVEDLPRDTPQHGFAGRILLAGERARDLIKQILAFSRHSPVERTPTDLARIVSDTRDMLDATLSAVIRLSVADEGTPLIADVNPTQMCQIVLNLCHNANDALAGSHSQGTISIALSRVHPEDADYARLRRDQRSHASTIEDEHWTTVGTLDDQQPYARLAVADSGSGMEPDVLRRVFDPFFTTKERGRGTGLGLSVVHGIVTAGKGACAIFSRVGEGTAVTIYVPLAAPEIVPAAGAAAAAEIRGRERILVVDDEIDSTDMLTIGLDRLGYEVVALNDPDEALAVFAEDPAAWDIVISDEAMPGMKGLVLFERLKAIRASLRFILFTGFSDGASETTALCAGVDAYVLKPVAPEQIAACVRRLMDRPPGTGAAARSFDSDLRPGSG